MCIDVTNTKPEPTGIGWKVFCRQGRYLTGDLTRGARRPTKRWLHESVYRVDADPLINPLPYDFGWHIFKDLQAAKEMCFSWTKIRRVRYRGAFVEGEFLHPNDVVVAKEIFIIPGEVI